MPLPPRTPPGSLAALLAILLLCIGPEIRADTEGDRIYDQAVAAFESGRNEEALAGFRELQATGVDDPAIDFNLGAIHYRLADHEQAVAAFSRAARDPRLTAVAAYNAALSAWQLKDRRLAADWLKRARDASPEAGLQELIDELGRTMAENHASRPGGLAYASIGYDSNVTLRADDETLAETGKGDTWLELYGDFDYAPRLLNQAGLSLRGSAWLLAHQDLHEYDTALFRLGAMHSRHFGAWRVDGELQVERTLADGSGLTSGHALRLEASRSFRPEHVLRLMVETGRTRESNARFAYLTGSHHAFELESAWQIRATRLRGFYRYEDNDRNDLREPVFISVSPRRHEIGGDVRFRLAGGNVISTGLRYRRSHYADPGELTDGSAMRRKDHRLRLFLRLSRSIGRDRELALQLQRTLNHSNVPAYDYRQGGVSLGLLLSW